MALVTRYSNGVLDPSVVPPRQVAEGIHNARIKAFNTRINLKAGDDIGSKYIVARVPSSARILTSAIMYPAVTGVSFTLGDKNDEDGLFVTSSFNSAGSKAVGATAATNGKMLWQLLGYTEDPGGELELYLKNTVAIPADVTIAAELLFSTP